MDDGYLSRSSCTVHIWKFVKASGLLQMLCGFGTLSWGGDRPRAFAAIGDPGRTLGLAGINSWHHDLLIMRKATTLSDRKSLSLSLSLASHLECATYGGRRYTTATCSHLLYDRMAHLNAKRSDILKNRPKTDTSGGVGDLHYYCTTVACWLLIFILS